MLLARVQREAQHGFCALPSTGAGPEATMGSKHPDQGTEGPRPVISGGPEREDPKQ